MCSEKEFNNHPSPFLLPVIGGPQEDDLVPLAEYHGENDPVLEKEPADTDHVELSGTRANPGCSEQPADEDRGRPVEEVPIDGEPRVTPSTETEEHLLSLLNQAQSTLEPTTPEEAIELYLEDKARECRQSTVYSHRSRLGFFARWCADEGFDNLNELTARDLHKYRAWRRESLNVVSEKTQMDTLRVFIEWCETIDAVLNGLSKKVRSPVIPDGENARETVLDADRTRTILEYLSKYEYASTEHIVWTILTETGMRMGAARALDVEDYQCDAEVPHLNVVHRPETGTPIKNGARGERRIGLSTGTCEILDDYLTHQQPNVTDRYDRSPLLATAQGRVSKSTIRTHVYKWSRPCIIGLECPHDKEPTECNAALEIDHASKCPSSVTPHPIRRGYITQLLQAGVDVQVVSDRCNVSPAVIDEHYDVRSEEAKMRQRQEVLRRSLLDNESGELG